MNIALTKSTYKIWNSHGGHYEDYFPLGWYYCSVVDIY
jgi:hypothetical protein